MLRRSLSIVAVAALAAASFVALSRPYARPSKKVTPQERDARAFLETASGLIQPLQTVANRAAWTAATDVTAEHTAARITADKALASVGGSKLVIEKSQALLKQKTELDSLSIRQLDKLLLSAADAPATLPDVVERRLEAEARQSAILDSYTFCLQNGAKGACVQPVSANDIDNLLRDSRNLKERERAFVASKEIGRALKPGLEELRGLRNQVARGMGHSSFFALQVADYGMTVEEMMALMDSTLAAIAPLYDGLHCFAKHTLAARFSQPVPRLIPAHWIGNRWAQSWPGLLESASLDPFFKTKSREFIMRTAEDFYVSLGFPRLPESFWQSSDLYPVDKASPRKKNSHASAWHIDGERDVRSLMSVEPNERWFGTAHHELGHIYYYLSYARPEVPFLLRTGANRAFHEAVGELARLASQQMPYLRRLGLVRQGQEPDPMSYLLQSALDSIVFLPFAAGTMSHFERDLYEADLAPAEWQARWWSYVTRYQGVQSPRPRADDLCDACTKTHINDDPAQYYDYALASLIKFQLHDHICSAILKQDVRACDYAGNQAVGDFLRHLLELGATRDWRQVMREATGEDIAPRALMAYFEPIVAELAKRNTGLDCSR
jgi:peptidyl-dipeptidase A